MQDLFLPATGVTPAVSFKFSQHHLALRGESYPENANAFYDPLMQLVTQYLSGLKGESVRVDVALNYFNSSSTKLLLSLFATFNTYATKGGHVQVNWEYDEEDDTLLEFGQELHDDNAALDFQYFATNGA